MFFEQILIGDCEQAKNYKTFSPNLINMLIKVE